MTKTIHDELAELASEFATLRQSNKKNWFPNTLWQRAIAISQQLTISVVCQAIKVHPAYFRKKIALLAPQDTVKDISFFELIPNKSNTLSIHVESSNGHKLSVDGLLTTDFAQILSEFLKSGAPCCK